MKIRFNLVLVTLAVLAINFIVGCGNNSQPMQGSSNNSPSAPLKEMAIQVEQTPGLGDTLSLFKQAYGEPKGKALFSFKDGQLLAMFVDDRAFNITVYHNNVSLKQAEEEASQYMPEDKTEIKRSTTKEPDLVKTVVFYNSLSLSSINEVKQYAELDHMQAGDFIVIYKANVNGQVYASIVGIGSKP